MSAVKARVMKVKTCPEWACPWVVEISNQHLSTHATWAKAIAKAFEVLRMLTEQSASPKAYKPTR